MFWYVSNSRTDKRAELSAAKTAWAVTDGALGGFTKQAPSLQTNVHNQWFPFPPPGKHMPLLPMYIIQQRIIKMSSPHLEDTRSPSLLLPLLLSICLADISAHTPGVQTHLMRCSCQVHGAATTVWVTDTPTPPLAGKSSRYPSHLITVTLAAARAQPPLSQQAALCGHKSQSDLLTSDGSEQSQTMLPLKHNQALAFLLLLLPKPRGTISVD